MTEPKDLSEQQNDGMLLYDAIAVFCPSWIEEIIPGRDPASGRHGGKKFGIRDQIFEYKIGSMRGEMQKRRDVRRGTFSDLLNELTCALIAGDCELWARTSRVVPRAMMPPTALKNAQIIDRLDSDVRTSDGKELFDCRIVDQRSKITLSINALNGAYAAKFGDVAYDSEKRKSAAAFSRKLNEFGLKNFPGHRVPKAETIRKWWRERPKKEQQQLGEKLGAGGEGSKRPI